MIDSLYGTRKYICTNRIWMVAKSYNIINLIKDKNWVLRCDLLIEKLRFFLCVC